MMCKKGQDAQDERQGDELKIHQKQELGAREETLGWLQFLEIWGDTGLSKKEMEAQVILFDCQLEAWP